MNTVLIYMHGTLGGSLQKLPPYDICIYSFIYYMHVAAHVGHSGTRASPVSYAEENLIGSEPRTEGRNLEAFLGAKMANCSVLERTGRFLLPHGLSCSKYGPLRVQKEGLGPS